MDFKGGCQNPEFSVLVRGKLGENQLIFAKYFFNLCREESKTDPGPLHELPTPLDQQGTMDFRGRSTVDRFAAHLWEELEFD